MEIMIAAPTIGFTLHSHIYLNRVVPTACSIHNACYAQCKCHFERINLAATLYVMTLMADQHNQ